MISAGIDIGSRTIKVVLVEDGLIKVKRKAENSFNTLEVCKNLIEGLEYDVITSTGYGRHLFKDHHNCETITEIKAFALGASFVLPTCRTILDIGGQDTKAISIDASGNFNKFEMNDKCAAGTGRFLEIMAMTLRYTLDEFGEKALAAESSLNVNSMCTVFAESEVVSLLAGGADRHKVARGIHQSIVSRSLTLLRRVGINNDIVFAGGVALNQCIVSLLEDQLKTNIHVYDDPQIIGAIGAAIYGTGRMV
jgi:(R)-2-hydroxyacyl-CoA dehydratese activating ATPase